MPTTSSSIRPTAPRAVLTVAALATTAVAAGVAAAGSAQAASAKVLVEERIQDHLVGRVSFHPHGEWLYACDHYADGIGISAQLKVGHKVYKVGDANGSQHKCGHRNLSIKEGRTVYLRLCANDTDCDGWLKGHA